MITTKTLFRCLSLLFAFTIITNASPNAFSSLGDELESFQKDCDYFKTIPTIPTVVKRECNVFSKKVKSAFKAGYKVDELAKKGKSNDKKLNQYLTLLRKADAQKDKVLSSLQSEKVKARKANNIKYYTQLITNPKIKLYSSDYEFMAQHLKDNKRYLQHQQYLKDLAQQSYETKKPIRIKKQKQKAQHAVKNDDKSLLKNVDLVFASTFLTNDNKTLGISIFYKNKKTDKIVSWEEGTVLVECIAYSNEGEFLKPKKGYPLGRIKKTVNRAFQTVYLDIKKTSKKSGVVECNVDTGFRKFHFEDIFLIKI